MLRVNVAQSVLMEELRRVQERRASADRAELALLRASRAADLSWSAVAQALGLGSKQAAEQRFRRLEARLPDASGVTAAQRDPAPVIAWPVGTRSRLIAAAARVLVERGYVSSRMVDIAEQANVAVGSIYHYFAAKDDLVAEVLRFGVQVTHRHVRAVLDGLPDDVSAAVRLDAAMSAHMAAVLELDAVARAHPHVYAQAPAVVRENLRPYRRAYGQLWEDVVGRARDDGVLRRDVDEFLLRLFLVNSLESVNQWITRSHLAPAELSQVVRRLLLEGVGGDPIPGSDGAPTPGR